MRRTILLGAIVAWLCIGSDIRAQDQLTPEQQVAAAAERLRAPGTEIERWQESIDQVVTTRYKSVGRLPGRFELDLIISACAVTKEDGATLRGVTIDAQNRYNLRAARVFVDEQEVPRLLETLAKLAEARREGREYEDFETLYHTAGGLRLRVFTSTSGQGGVAAAVELRQRGLLAGPVVDLPVDQLTRLRTLIEQAMAVGKPAS